MVSLEVVMYTDAYRNLILGLDTLIPTLHGTYVKPINFDNAATTPPLKQVMNDINAFCPWYSSIHRGTGYKSVYSSKRYEQARQEIASFVGADADLDTLIFVKNTTEALNKLAYRTITKTKDAVVLTTLMEHHSNDLPWRESYKVDYIDIDECGRLCLKDLEQKLINYDGRVKLVTVTGASNVTGHVNPIHAIAKLAHQYGAQILVDGAQLVPHRRVDMKAHSHLEHIDFIVFSAHKMYAPFGIGVLIGPKTFFHSGSPDIKGGGTVKIVTKDVILWDDPPYKEEAGSPNIIGALALESAVKVLKYIGMDRLEHMEYELTKYAMNKLKDMPEIELYGDCYGLENRVGIITFNIQGLHHEVVATALSSESGIAVRNGCFCAQPYVQKLLNISPADMKTHVQDLHTPHPGMVRISFGLYNTFEEVDDLCHCLYDICKNKQYYKDTYLNKES